MRVRAAARLVAVTAIGIAAIGFATVEAPRAESTKEVRCVAEVRPWLIGMRK